MQKRVLLIFMLLLLCGCSSSTKESSNQDDTVSLQQPGSAQEEEKEIPPVTVTEYPLPEEVAKLEKLDVMELGLCADEKQSMHNSNQLNFGTLTSDGEGHIYFTDFTENAIFTCGPEGENKRLLYEGSGEYLYVSGGYLYFGSVEPEDKYIDGFVRIELGTEEAELLYGEPCGEVMVVQDKMYFDNRELAGMSLGEPDGKPAGLSEIEPAFFNSDGRYLFYNMIVNETSFLFERGYWMAWDIETETNYFVGSKMVFPLLAGNWLSYVDIWTGTRHVLDLETGEDTDLGRSIQRAVSDGSKMYWCVQEETGYFQIFQWDGKEIQELCTVEVESERYGDARLFLAEGYLYWIFEIGISEESEWGYYRLSDGKTGRLN